MSEGLYSVRQRVFAGVYGGVTQVLYVASILSMALGLASGMTLGRGRFQGLQAVAANVALLMFFPVLHSLLLGARGRKVVARAMPFGLGGALSTTTFALVSALQLLMVFWLWSPAGVVWWRPQGLLAAVWIAVHVASWLFLGKALMDSQLSLHTGTLGWWAVVRNRKPQYKPFATQGVYRHVRQPIYLGFALILWTAPVWTPDWLVLAGGWSLYCFVGAMMKERRFVGFFGDKFRAYQQRVPFWLPRFARSAAVGAVASGGVASPLDCDVLVVGAGPIGLLLAGLLAKAGVRVQVIDKRHGPPEQSMAIGITPPTLQILHRLGLDQAFESSGVLIQRAVVHENQRVVGQLGFQRVPSPYRYVLSLPQSETVSLLAERVARDEQVTLRQGVEFEGLAQDEAGVTATVRDAASGAMSAIRARLLVGCDGNRSRVRECLGLAFRGRQHAQRFVMADYADDTGLGADAHLFFTRDASVESFPLPGKRRRWIVLERPGAALDPGAYLVDKVRRLTGHELAGCARSFLSGFQPRSCMAERYSSGRVVLCGDAAHVMSPIGGQGMNTGLADAELLAELLPAALAQAGRLPSALAVYERFRRRAFRVAARRAVMGMWLGTRRGAVASALRGWLVRQLLLHPGHEMRLAQWFTMLSVPFHNASRVTARE